MVVDKEAGFKALQEWIDAHLTLPRKIDSLLVRRYLQVVRYDIEKAKKLLEGSFEMRNNYADIFLRRDPTDKSSQKTMQLIDMLPLPIPSKDNCKVLLYRLADQNADEFNFNDAIKMFFMVADVRMKMLDENGLTDGEIPIFDMAGFSVKHLTKVVLSTLRIYMKYTQEAHPVRPRQIHIINCSPFLDKILMLVKPFVKKEVFKLLHFHLPNSSTLDNFVPPEFLPSEYGGRAGDLKKLKSDITQQLIENRDYLMDADRWKMSKSKKYNIYRSQVETITNFRTLSID